MKPLTKTMKEKLLLLAEPGRYCVFREYARGFVVFGPGAMTPAGAGMIRPRTFWALWSAGMVREKGKVDRWQLSPEGRKAAAKIREGRAKA